MSNLTGKGYMNKATTFVVAVEGKALTYTSNACRFDDFREKAKLDCELISATTYSIYDGRNEEEIYTDVIWVVYGTLPSGKALTEYLLEKGAITEEQATAILNAKTSRL